MRKRTAAHALLWGGLATMIGGLDMLAGTGWALLVVGFVAYATGSDLHRRARQVETVANDLAALEQVHLLVHAVVHAHEAVAVDERLSQTKRLGDLSCLNRQFRQGCNRFDQAGGGGALIALEFSDGGAVLFLFGCEIQRSLDAVAVGGIRRGWRRAQD